MNNPKTITIASNSNNPLIVNRLGYGTMQLTGEGVYGEPPNRPEALAILKQAIRSGVNFLDTADYYGEDVTNRLIEEALYPYPRDLVICTKVGATRTPDKNWLPFLTPDNIRSAIEKNLKTLRLEQITLVHLRVMPRAKVPFKESLEALFELQKEGKVLHVGVSNVNVEELELAMSLGSIATVENMYGHASRITARSPMGENRGGEEIIRICEENHIPLIPYWTLHNAIPKKDVRISEISEKLGYSEAQVNLAWLLNRSPWLLPIPGTKQLTHFEENLEALEITLSEKDMSYLD